MNKPYFTPKAGLEVLRNLKPRMNLFRWPDNCCTDTCDLMYPILVEKFTGIFRIIDGTWDDNCENHHGGKCLSPCGKLGHTWITYRPEWHRTPNDTIIIDPTVGQFTLSKFGQRSALEKVYQVYRPGDREYSYYYPERTLR